MTLAIVITARPSYSRLRSLIAALVARGVTVRVLVGGSAVLDRYGSVVDVIESDGLPVAWRGWTVIEGETHETAARSTGLLMVDLASALRVMRPDAVLVHADRHEVLGAAIAARYLELPLIHTQGGEQTGSIDDRVRDAITQLADYHLVSTPAAASRIQRMRGHDAIVTGCPSLDVARQATLLPPVQIDSLPGDGRVLNPSAPFLVVLQHPVTDHADGAYDEMRETLEAVRATQRQALVLWPGDEAGMAGASKAIREAKATMSIRTCRNLPPEIFLRLLMQAECLIGNSSVGIRECSYLGVPVVNIGDRQAHRERAGNVLDVPARAETISAAWAWWRTTPRPERSTLYGDGQSGPRMADAIVRILQDLAGGKAA